MATPSPKERLLLYLAVSEHAVSATLMKNSQKGLSPIYYVSKMLLDVETRYLPLKILALALVSATQKLWYYFQAHTIVVLTDQPLKALFRKADLTGKISKWAIELSEFDVQFERL